MYAKVYLKLEGRDKEECSVDVVHVGCYIHTNRCCQHDLGLNGDQEVNSIEQNIRNSHKHEQFEEGYRCHFKSLRKHGLEKITGKE
jgi:hypothetical protein